MLMGDSDEWTVCVAEEAGVHRARARYGSWRGGEMVRGRSVGRLEGIAIRSVREAARVSRRGPQREVECSQDCSDRCLYRR